MTSRTIYYVRHGETAWNAAGRFQGTRDIPLNALGRSQAVAAGEILAGLLAREVTPPLPCPMSQARSAGRG